MFVSFSPSVALPGDLRSDSQQFVLKLSWLVESELLAGESALLFAVLAAFSVAKNQRPDALSVWQLAQCFQRVKFLKK